MMTDSAGRADVEFLVAVTNAHMPLMAPAMPAVELVTWGIVSAFFLALTLSVEQT